VAISRLLKYPAVMKNLFPPASSSSEIADVDPDEGAGFGDGFFGFSGHDVSDALVGGIEGVEGLDVVDDGA